VMKAVKILQTRSLDPTVIIMPTIKPLDEALIKKIAVIHSYIFSVEEHSIIGGLGSAIAETLSELNLKVNFKRIGINDSYYKTVGDQDFLRRRYGLMPDQIAKNIQQSINL